MGKQLDKQKLEELYLKNISYKEIAEITGYNINSVNGYFYRIKGKMKDTRFYRRNSLPISQIQKEILFGTLLGDGNIQKQKIRSYIGKYNHSLEQKIYCDKVRTELLPLVSELKYSDTKNKKYPNKIYKNCYFYLKNNLNLEELYNMFYIKENNKKDVPFDLSLLTPRAMAYWFMDDGTANGNCSISIATCSFSLEGLLRLKNYLLITYGIEVTITKEFRLYFNTKTVKIFYNLVKEYIIPEMEYKFRYLNKPVHLKHSELLETPEDNNTTT